MQRIEARPKLRLVSAVAVLVLLAGPLAAQPLDSAFTYQGRLQDAGAPANGPYDFRFILFDAAVGGAQIGPIVNRDDVVVATGLFTVSIDFGPSAFAGSKRWMEVAIRPGPSGGAYTPLSERQELQPAPHAGFSLRSVWSGIAGKPAGFADDVDNDTTYGAGTGLDLTGTVFSLADGGVTAAKLANNAVTSAKITDGTIALADLGANGCLPSQILKWNGIAWACAFDVDTNSGGTVTSVATGAGLTGGPISTTGTVAVATGGISTAMLASGAVTSAKIANGAVGLAQINTAEVQARIATTCPTGQYFRGINPDGTALCEPFFAPNVITTVDDPANNVGQYTSMAIGNDGRPVISYWDSTDGDLKAVLCGNSACTSGNRIVLFDFTANVVGEYTSVAIGADGFLVISYFDSTAGNLKVVHCSTATCSVSSLATVDNSANVVGLYTSIAIGTDGLPVISYFDDTADDLKVVHCGVAACSAGNTITVVDSANSVGSHTSIAIGGDGFPVISYYDATLGNLKFAHCGNVACTSGNTTTTIDASSSDAGFENSIAIGADGFPVISYYDQTFTDLRVAHCNNATCTPVATLTIVDPLFVGRYTSIAIGSDGLPVVSYLDLSGGALKVAHCGNAACTAGNALATVDAVTGSVIGFHTSIAIGTDGLPVISYYDNTAGTLKVAKCAQRTCQ